jgi:hypothetical protein
MSEAIEVLEGIKSLTAEEPPALDVQAIAEAATRSVVEALSAQPPAEAELERLPEPEPDAVTAVMEKPTTVSAPAIPDGCHAKPVMPQAVLLPAEPILLSAEIVSLLRASLKANLQDVTNKVLWIALKD